MSMYKIRANLGKNQQTQSEVDVHLSILALNFAVFILM